MKVKLYNIDNMVKVCVCDKDILDTIISIKSKFQNNLDQISNIIKEFKTDNKKLRKMTDEEIEYLITAIIEDYSFEGYTDLLYTIQVNDRFNNRDKLYYSYLPEYEKYLSHPFDSKLNLDKYEGMSKFNVTTETKNSYLTYEDKQFLLEISEVSYDNYSLYLKDSFEDNTDNYIYLDTISKKEQGVR